MLDSSSVVALGSDAIVGLSDMPEPTWGLHRPCVLDHGHRGSAHWPAPRYHAASSTTRRVLDDIEVS